MMDSQPGGAGMKEIILDRRKDLWRLMGTGGKKENPVKLVVRVCLGGLAN